MLRLAQVGVAEGEGGAGAGGGGLGEGVGLPVGAHAVVDGIERLATRLDPAQADKGIAASAGLFLEKGGDRDPGGRAILLRL